MTIVILNVQKALSIKTINVVVVDQNVNYVMRVINVHYV